MTSKNPIYLDHHATTPCDARVLEAMMPVFSETFGNAASRQHAFGWQAEALVDRAREQVAALINCNPTEIIFTSGATESDNLAIKGVARSYAAKGKHIVTDVIEHHAVLDSCGALEKEGFRVTYLPVQPDGWIRPEEVEAAIEPDTVLVTVMYANNEIGTINPVGEIGAVCRGKGVLFHCDAVQAMAYLPCDVQELGIDLLSISAHKMYGPKGVGALFVRRRRPRVRLKPIIDGGGHERGMRSGTLNVPGIVGLGMACEICSREREADAERVRSLRDRLREKILAALPDAVLNGSIERRLPNNLNISFPGIDGDALMARLGPIAVSSGSACTSASPEPSYVLKSLGVSDAIAAASIRFGLGRSTTQDEIDRAADATIEAVKHLASISPHARAGEEDSGVCASEPALSVEGLPQAQPSPPKKEA